jgi:hypothetical protein
MRRFGEIRSYKSGEQGTGQFLAEVAQLSGRVALVDGHGAIGEGAQVVAALHGFLGDSAKPAL